MRRIILLIFAFGILASVNALAEEPEGRWDSLLSGFNAGLGGTVITNEYKDMRGDTTVLPLLGYEGTYIYLRGVAAGVHLFKNDWLEFNAQVSYLPQHFYADDSGDWHLRRLDDRYSTLMGGANARLLLPFGIIGATISTDLLGYSNGILLDAGYTLPLEMGIVNLAPSVGLQWTDANYNQYYYSIDSSESKRSGLSYYEPDGSVSPYAQLSAKINFNDQWSAFASCRALFLDQEITNSPMVEGSEKYSFSLGAMYSF